MFPFISNVYGNTAKQSCVVLPLMKQIHMHQPLPSDHWPAHHVHRQSWVSEELRRGAKLRIFILWGVKKCVKERQESAWALTPEPAGQLCWCCQAHHRLARLHRAGWTPIEGFRGINAPQGAIDVHEQVFRGHSGGPYLISSINMLWCISLIDLDERRLFSQSAVIYSHLHPLCWFGRSRGAESHLKVTCFCLDRPGRVQAGSLSQ